MQLDTAKITQNTRILGTKDADAATHLVCVLDSAFDIARLPHGSVLKQRLKDADHRLKPGAPFQTLLPNARGTLVALVAADSGQSAFDRLTQARKALATLRPPAPEALTLACFGLKADAAGRACEAFVAAALAADFRLPAHKSKPDKTARLRAIHIYGHVAKDGYARTVAEARGNNLARYLTALPPNELTPGNYRKRVEKLAREYGWKTEFLDIPKLKKLGAGAFLAVAQGSPEPDAGILRLRYTPKSKSAKPALALVGKGICFDTGGTNLKNAKYMHGMHEDMQGSAVALGTGIALAELKVPFAFDVWMAITENRMSARAYKSQDVVTAANGTTIQVIHTDAEGRMVLADTLALAAREEPALIIDYATLTGTCILALTERYAGVFSNRVSAYPFLTKAGVECGERVWPFPMDEDFDEALRSEIADVKQCSPEGNGDHILAARFLNRFVPKKIPWIHIDLSAGQHKEGLAHIPTEITGFGVGYTLELLRKQAQSPRELVARL
jgi:leucyl aminopeptidase